MSTNFNGDLVEGFSKELQDLLLSSPESLLVTTTLDTTTSAKHPNCQQLIQIIKSTQFAGVQQDTTTKFDYMFVQNLINEMRDLLLSFTQTYTVKDVLGKITQKDQPTFYKLIQGFAPKPVPKQKTRAELLEEFKKLSIDETINLYKLLSQTRGTPDQRFSDPEYLFNSLISNGYREQDLEDTLKYSKMFRVAN